MFQKLKRTKVFRDPLYGYITVDYQVISDLIDTKEFQRLRRIRQLSGVSMVFQTAEHSRFTHSLGAYQMANFVINNVEGIECLTEYERLLFLITALFHDIGHGPYSHAFETILSVPHEEMGARIITGNTEVNEVLVKENPSLPNDIASIIRHEGKYKLIESLVSSQLDVDRMDYLSRDAYFTGAAYGHIDYFRILRSMKIINNRLYVRASGVHSIESYLMSRYHMYFQVYYHPQARSYECILDSIYKRIKDLIEANKLSEANANIKEFVNVIKNPNDLDSYYELDDAYVNAFIKKFTKTTDKILKTLCNAFIKRHLFECIEMQNDPDINFIKEVKAKYTQEELPYYFTYSKVSLDTYNHSSKGDINDIKVLLPDSKAKSLDQYSPIIKDLRTSGSKTVERYYYFIEE